MPLIGCVPDAKLPPTLPPPDSDLDVTPTISQLPNSPHELRKRTRVIDDPDERHSNETNGGPASKRQKTAPEFPIAAIQPPPLAFPKSLYDGYQHSLPTVSEKDVLQEISADAAKEQVEDSDADDFIDAELEDFVIYREHKSFRINKSNRVNRVNEAPLANELVSLHEINEWNVRGFYFDGVIWFAGRRHYVQKVPFETLSIGGYAEMECPVVPSDLWIQSHHSKRFNVWYRLRTPAQEYKRYHKPFLWMAELAKHVVDYLSLCHGVTLDHFQQKFGNWLEEKYPMDNFIHQWKQQYGSKDFRPVIVSQANFLWCQASQVDESLEQQSLWNEIHPRFLNAVPEEQEKHAKSEMFATTNGGEQTVLRKTTVTPYVYEYFKHLPWARFLYCQAPTAGQSNKKKVSLPTHGIGARITSVSAPGLATSINVGDVVALPLDNQSAWKSADKEWLGYVQGITDTFKGRELGLLWLYRPSDTVCLKVPFPYRRELFLSDHCNCGDSPIFSEEIIRKPRTAFFSDDSATSDVEFFIRQKYVEGDQAWQTLKESDFICDCRKKREEPRLARGTTVLVSLNNILEPAVIHGYEPDSHESIKIRRLRRRCRDYQDAKAQPNELVFTNQFQILSVQKVHRECQVRFYTEEARQRAVIPAPYNRQGMGDFYFVSAQDTGSGLKNLADSQILSGLREGWNPQLPSGTPMKGLDIFCGGGSFGRGLEESGAVHFDHAVDWYNEAIHTYKANLQPGSTTRLFRGSVNDYLTQAIQGKPNSAIAACDAVEVIIAGSPCQGFSHANPNKVGARSLLHVSMVASVVAFIDFYRPKYAILENVKGMASGPDTENILAMVISALLGIGYQVRTFALDAWNYGCPQSRSRVFISVAAPGLNPLPEPPHTHSHPENVPSASLGTLPNGLRSSSRYTSHTPFKYITAAEATKDLPSTDARVSCIPFPDHRMSRVLSTLSRIQVGSVPRFPRGQTFITAASGGYMPKPQLENFDWSNEVRCRKDARGWQRVRRNALMPTVLTEPRPDDGAGGTCLHWDQERLLTIMEVRRGQGFPDDEVLVGLPREQWKIVGNSVGRPVALALGLSLRKAWLLNDEPSQKTMKPNHLIKRDADPELFHESLNKVKIVDQDSEMHRLADTPENQAVRLESNSNSFTSLSKFTVTTTTRISYEETYENLPVPQELRNLV
ncbi:hypothetical protein ACLMJK_000377 [Lecanora helva]